MNYYTSAPAPAAEAETAGITRWTAPTAAPSHLAAAPESTRVVGSALQFTAGQEQAHETGPARHVVSHSGTPGGSLMASLQIQGAGHKTVELTPGDPTSRTRIEVAVRQGLIREVSPGRFEDVAAAVAPASAGPTAQGLDEQAATDAQDTDGPDTEAFDAEDVASWASAIAPLSQTAYDAAAASATLAAVTGSDLGSAIRGLVSNTGMEPEQARLYVEAGVAMHERAVAAAVAPLGITDDRLEAFYEAVRQQPAKLQDAIQRLTQQRSTPGFQKLAAEFNRTRPADVSMWKGAGFETHMGHDGLLLLKRPGGDWVKAKDMAR